MILSLITNYLSDFLPAPLLILFPPPLSFLVVKTIEELMNEQKELEAEAAEEGKAVGIPQPQSSMYDSKFAQVN